MHLKLWDRSAQRAASPKIKTNKEFRFRVAEPFDIISSLTRRKKELLMKTKKSLLVVPAIALVFALAFTTCSNGSTGGGKDTGSTQGQLAFERITDGENAGTWRVRKGTVTSGKVVIPAYYNGSTGRAARSAEDGDPVTEIGWKYDPEGGGAFSRTDITEIIIPDTIESIGFYAFQDCPNLSAITIPASVERIGSWVFAENRNLKNIIVEAGNQNYIVEDGILYQIGGEYLSFTTNEYLNDFVVEKKILHSYPSASGNITIPADVVIGTGAFFGTTITSVTIPEGVEIIEYHAFAHCNSLKSITIPASVKYIGSNVFQGSTNLTSITVASGNPYYSSEGGILYVTNNPYSFYVDYGMTGKVLFACPSAKGNITIPVGVTAIGDGAFIWNTNLTGVTIPESVTYIGWTAFAACFGIKSITIPASVTKVESDAFSMWTSSQTINVKGHANQASADAAWGEEWRKESTSTVDANGIYYLDIKATIKYWNGSSYQ